MALQANNIIEAVWHKLDQYPLVNEDVQTDSAVIGSASTNFSEENLIERINHVQRFIATQVKAMHIPGCITQYTGPYPYVSANVDLIRPLFSRNFRDTVRATQRSIEREQRLTATGSGRAASASYPTVNYEDGYLVINPTGGSSYVSYLVTSPPDVDDTADTLTLDERFEGALIFFVVSSCLETMRQTDLSQAWYDLAMDEIRPYLRENRLDRVFNDREVDVE